MNTKLFFSLMLKYHSVIIGRLLYLKKITIDDEKISIYNSNLYTDNSNNKTYPIESEYIPFCTEEFGIKKIPVSSWDLDRNENYFHISLLSFNDFRELIDSGIDVFNGNSCSAKYFCLMSSLEKVLELFHEKIHYITLPHLYKRLDTRLVPYYCQIVQNQIDYFSNYFKKYDSNDVTWGNAYSFEPEYNNDYPLRRDRKWFNNKLLKHGIFDYLPIYTEIPWDFDMVRKYKDLILWPNLLESSDLKWTEKELHEFSDYIPHEKIRSSKVYCNNTIPTIGYGFVDNISNEYIFKNINKINWEVFVETANFQWSGDVLKYIYRKVNHDCDKWNKVWSIYNLINNKNFKWNTDNLKAMIEVDSSTLNYIIKDERLHNVFLNIPDYKNLAIKCLKDFQESKLWEDDDDVFDSEEEFKLFMREFKDHGEQKHNSYSEFFTIENIEKNKEDWDKIIDDKYLSMIRTSDVNYHYYAAFTMWDYFALNKYVLLTYELVKYLKNITINTGGAYVMENSVYLGEDHRNQKKNGLEEFKHHNIATDEDFEKIIYDEEVLDIFLKEYPSPNIYIIDYLINKFFEDFSLLDYITLVNNLKDWNNYYIFKED